MENEKQASIYALPISIILAGIMIAVGVYASKVPSPKDGTTRGVKAQGAQTIKISAAEEAVTPVNGVILPVSWGDLGVRLVNSGTIDAEKFKAIYEGRGQFTEEYKKLLLGQNDGKLKITKTNAGFILNLLWALGLANNNPVLYSGEMIDSKYGGAQGFASTGGWTLAKGSAMDHYSQHVLFNLTAEQQEIVERVSKNIYRPCCNNSTHFPDCNHGMAMLGLLELMASQGVSEQDMYKAALVVNSYWFPGAYMTLENYMETRGIAWDKVQPEIILGSAYSSASGFAKISSLTTQKSGNGGAGGCGVDSPLTTQQQSSCGI